MNDHVNILILLITLPLFFSPFVHVAEGGKRRIHITDDLDDVVDDEEDEAWKQWGKKTTTLLDEMGPPPTDFSGMSMEEIQVEMMKRNVGPVFGFVKLRPGLRRTSDTVAETAMKWTNVMKSGAVEVRFTGIDLNTIMFNLQQGRHSMELKEFILNQPEAYEIKIGDHVFRRPGDPPLEQVIEKLRSEKDKVKEDAANTQDNLDLKEEL